MGGERGVGDGLAGKEDAGLAGPGSCDKDRGGEGPDGKSAAIRAPSP